MSRESDLWPPVAWFGHVRTFKFRDFLSPTIARGPVGPRAMVGEA